MEARGGEQCSAPLKRRRRLKPTLQAEARATKAFFRPMTLKTGPTHRTAEMKGDFVASRGYMFHTDDAAVLDYHRVVEVIHGGTDVARDQVEKLADSRECTGGPFDG